MDFVFAMVWSASPGWRRGLQIGVREISGSTVHLLADESQDTQAEGQRMTRSAPFWVVFDHLQGRLTDKEINPMSRATLTIDYIDWTNL